MKNKILCPSMMCADFTRIQEEMRLLEEAQIDIYHCDVMDGNFVENMALAINDIQCIRKLTQKEIDVHLMIENPSKKVDWFIEAGADIIYIHPESERYVSKTLRYIQSMGRKAGIAINPDTSFEAIYELLKFCDLILIMTVSPGFSGQAFEENTLDKICKIVKLKESFGYKVIIDGACSSEVIKNLSYLGVDGFILGTSALFGKNRSYREIIRELRDL